ncbi:MAG: mechanosensitive ion channel family protein [Phycisphaerales bacterium]|nr:MAG: mechanosensitive ion channel family protein [Phycisphaerales bacterium]
MLPLGQQLAGQTWLPLVLSGASLVLALLCYRWLTRRGETKWGKAVWWENVSFLVSLILLLVVVLAWIWRGRVAWLKAATDWFLANQVYANIIWTVLAIAAVYFIGHVVERALQKSATDLVGKHKIRRATSWLRAVVLTVILVAIWISGAGQMGVFLGVMGAGIALSLQEVLLCVAGWALIIIKRPFDIGDRIELSGHVGDVIDIRVFQTSLLEVGNWVGADQSTGRIISVPNSAVFRQLNANYTKGFPFIWNEQTIVVTFESDWKRAKELMLKQAQEEAQKIETEVRRQIETMQSQYAIRYSHLTPIVYTHIADQGVALTLRYLCPVRKRRGMAHSVNEGILEDFAREANIDLAYPTTRFFDANREERPVRPRTTPSNEGISGPI